MPRLSVKTYEVFTMRTGEYEQIISGLEYEIAERLCNAIRELYDDDSVHVGAQ